MYFEIDDEDKLRKVGMSKERRVDPQIQVGLLVDRSGFPLEIHCFEGNTAETKTLIPVLTAFQDRHGVTDMVVVADAGMLSAANLNALEDAGFSFIVGSRITKAPYDLAEHFKRHGDYFANGQILESRRVMGTRKAARERRIVYQYLFKRYKRDNKSINAMVERAEKVAAGTRAVKKDRFVTISGASKGVNWALVERARQLAGLKGYVTNIDPEVMGGAEVIAAYHDLWPGREELPDGQERPSCAPDIPSRTRLDRGPPDHRARSPRRRPPPPRRHRGLDQEARRHTPPGAFSDHRPCRAAPHRRTRGASRGTRHPDSPRPNWLLTPLARVRSETARTFRAPSLVRHRGTLSWSRPRYLLCLGAPPSSDVIA